VFAGCCCVFAEMTYFKYLADLEPVEVCMMIGTCMDTVLHKLQVSVSQAARGGLQVCACLRKVDMRTSPWEHSDCAVV
jgi:hypothetical protein